MPDRTLLRIGAASAIAGSILAIVGNALLPRGADPADMTASLRQIADSNLWLGDHVGILVGVLLITGGLVALYRSITAEPGASLARLGFAAMVVTTPVLFIALASEGMALKALAGTGGAAATAVYQVNLAVFSFWIIVFGAVPILYGLAVALSDGYIKWLGWVAVAAGIGLVVVGLVQAYEGPSTLVTNVLFAALSMIVTLWVLAMGVLMWRKAT